MNIVDLFGRLVLDDKGFKADVVKSSTEAGDAAGKTLGTRVSAGLKGALGAGAKVGGAALAGGLAIATKGVIELENVTASYRAETGATAEEARKAGEAINAMAGRNLQPLGEIGDTMSKVTTDLGLTGDAAAATTESFLKFARATGQDSTSAVAAFDDILDGFGLTAEDSQGIMDKLVVSHQKYGGSISDNQSALAKMAPQLKALNLGLDDGVGLLNLFAASGLDASSGQKALNAAVKNLPPGESLDQFVKRLSMVTDDGERARLAMEVFGARAGAGLANAIKPGMAGLADFQVSTEDATGATLKAQEALDGTFGNRLKILLKGATSALTGFGSSFGPALTGIGAVASLAGSLGGKQLVGGILKPIGGLGVKLGAKLAAAIGISFASSAVSGAASAGGDAVGNLTSSAIAKRLAGKPMADAIGNGLIGAGSSPAVSGATGKLGSFLGSGLGKALSVGFAVAAVGAVAETYQRINTELTAQTNQIGADLAKQFVAGTTTELAASRGAIVDGLNRILAIPFASTLYADQIKALQDQGAAIDAEMSRRVNEAQRAGEREGSAYPTGVATGITGGASAVGAAALGLAGQVAGASGNLKAAGTAIGTAVTSSLASAILDSQGFVGGAMAALRNQITNERGPIAQAGQDIGALVSTEVANGIGAKRAGVREQAKLVRDAAEAELRKFIAGGGRIGKAAMASLVAAEKSKDPDVRDAAKRTRAIIEGNVKPNTKPAGRTAGQGVIDGLNGKGGAVATAAANLGARAARALKRGFGSPNLRANIVIGNSGYLGGARAHGGPVTAGVPYIVGENRPELFVPRVSGTILPKVPSLAPGAAPGGATTINLSTYGMPMRAETPFEQVTQLRRAARLGVLTATRRTAWSPNG